MSLPINPNRFFCFKAVVTALYPSDRTIDVINAHNRIPIKRVYVVMDAGNFSFPNLDDIGLVMGDETAFYYLGRLDNNYQQKIAGNVKDANGNKLAAKLVNGGESMIMNLAKRIGLFFSNNGNFSLINDFLDGLIYTGTSGNSPLRLTELAGQTIQLTGGLVKLNVGSVIRNVIAQGKKAIVDSTNPTQYGAEVKAEIQTPLALPVAKFHMGNILMEPVADPMAGIPTPGTFVAPLRALLSVFSELGVETTTIKMDQTGNMEIAAKLPGTGLLAISAGVSAGLDAPRVDIGGLPPPAGVLATEPCMQGIKFAIWFKNFLDNYLATHTHQSPVGPTGIPIQPTVPFEPVGTEYSSTKVYIGG
jgi:hypothetical protein